MMNGTVDENIWKLAIEQHILMSYISLIGNQTMPLNSLESFFFLPAHPPPALI